MIRYKLGTLVWLTTVGPPMLARAWLWCRQLIVDALILLMCEFFAAAILVAVLAIGKLAWEIAKGAVWLSRVLLRLAAVGRST